MIKKSITGMTMMVLLLLLLGRTILILIGIVSVKLILMIAAGPYRIGVDHSYYISCKFGRIDMRSVIMWMD